MKLTRRQFLARAAISTTALSALPFHSFAAQRATPSDQIRLGAIGVGARCRDVLSHFLNLKDCRVTAIADVKEDALATTKALVDERYQDTACATHRDFRELLQRRDIDAVVIASTDNWHVPHAIAAVRAGKDVYLEKPMGLTLGEDQALRREVQKNKAVFQFGTQQRSDRKFRVACELVRNGHIGKLKHINVWAPASEPGGSTKLVPPPSTVDYDYWVGPAPFRPHTEKLTTNETWWFISDFAVGFIAGWGIHPMDIALWGAGDMMRDRVRVDGQGLYASGGSHDTAIKWDVNFLFDNQLTVRFVGSPNGLREPFTAGEEWKKRYGEIETHGTAFEGDKGWVHVDRSRIQVNPENLIDLKPDDFKVQLTRSSDHAKNFLDCIRSRKPTVCPIEDAVLADAFCIVPDIMMRLGRPVTYDVRREQFVGDKEANTRLKTRQARKPYSIV